MYRIVASLAFAGLALSACGEPEPAGGALPPPSDVTTDATGDPVATTSPEDRGPYDPAAQIRPDLMVIQPTSVVAGETVLVTFPDETMRGVAYVLERSIASSWSPTFLMTSSTDGYGAEPTWAEIDSDGYGWDDIGVGGPGPDTLVIPDPAVAGDYRLCTANSAENICAELTITKVDDTPGVDADRDPLGEGSAGPLEEVLGEPLSDFEMLAAELGFGPIRVAWLDGEYLALTDDLVPGRVNVAVETVDGVELVIDAIVEGAVIVGTYEGVEFYPACGNETLDHLGVRWHPVHQREYPELYEMAARGDREQPPETVTVRGFAPRVAEPGPGDDVGTLVVWSDGVAYFVSDSGDLYVWLVDDELTYPWEC